MFFTGLHQPSDAHHFERAFVSVHRLKRRRKPLGCAAWIMDSGAFSIIKTHGGYPFPGEEYAAHIRRFSSDPTLLAAVAQDYMCEAPALARTGLTVADHQRLTIQRYDALTACNTGVYIMPVLQGWVAMDYVDHLREYGDRLPYGAWVGVGSVCKRNATPTSVARVLLNIKHERPDLRLHGFGCKVTALGDGLVRELLHSADSMAWSFAARRQGGNANDYREALAFTAAINSQRYVAATFVPGGGA
jgi:hypothetical protein